MSSPAAQHYLPVREAWLATNQEEILDPAQVIIDPHHHLWDRPGWRYLLADILADLGSGHDVRATVFVQARAAYRAEGPEELKPVGETEFANAAAEACTGDMPRVCAGIVGFADLTRGAAVRPVLEAHVAAAGGPGGRFRGIRHIATWDPDPALLNPAYLPSEDMLASDAFRAGFAELAPLGLSFDAWLYFHQIPRLVELARAFPQTPIVLDHVGGVLGIGRYAGRRDEVFAEWLTLMRELASCPNVWVKLGGLGMRLPGYGFEELKVAPSSTVLAASWKPWMESCIDLFGSGRCMFESNFPVDKGSFGYVAGWNAFKRLAAGAGAAEKADLFWRSAARFYRLPGFD